jgi:exodeoxyribonuclease VII small subunit
MTRRREPDGLETRIARLEEIVADMEGDSLDLEDALRLFEEGVGHIREADALLRTSEVRVEKLLEEAERRPERDATG